MLPLTLWALCERQIERVIVLALTTGISDISGHQEGPVCEGKGRRI